MKCGNCQRNTIKNRAPACKSNGALIADQPISTGNAPEFFGLYGLMVYKSTYAEEEAVRWCGRLFRHYCIEGHTDLLSERYGFKYRLDHIQNGDFDDGLTGWTVSEAEKDKFRANMRKKMENIRQMPEAQRQKAMSQVREYFGGGGMPGGGPGGRTRSGPGGRSRGGR